MAIIKAGTYRFNDVLTEPSWDEQKIDFTFVLSYESISSLFSCNRITIAEYQLRYVVVSAEPMVDGLLLPSEMTMYPDAFKYGIGQTITIPNDSEVSAEFYEWFTANALGHTTISGTWRLKDEPIWGDALTEKVSFISNENNYSAFSFHNGSSFDAIRYYYSSSDYDLAYEHSYEPVWEAEEYKTISFVGEQEVSQQFYDLFTANAVEQKEEPELPIVTPTKKTTYPILYSATETNFDHNGFGILSACVSCEVTEEANGIFELAMQYPMDGIHYEYIADRAIIKAKADQFRDPQLFRVYAISKPMNGIVTVLAEHISYDLSGIPIKPFSADSVALALSGLKSNSVVPCPFNFWTDKATSANFKVTTPASIRSRLGGVSGSILDVYGGEYEFDNYTVKLHNNRGMNRGVSIRYGKNLTDIKQEQNCSSVATGVYPYWVSPENGELVELPEKIINAPGTYNFVKIRTVDFSQSFENKPTEEQLRKKTESYIKNNDIGVPKVSMTVSFAQLEQTEEYKHLKLLERVALFDTVNVEFPALGVSATAKAVKLVYDVLADRVKSVTLGSVRANIADTIANQQQEINQKPSKTFMEVAVENLTKTILGAKGGSVRFLDENGDGEPDTLYIADNPDPTQAAKVWRFNYEGWGASENGYNGPFKVGATIKNGIVADFITAGTLNSALINGKTLVIEDGAVISTWKVDENSIYENEGYWPQGTFMCTGSKGSYSIGGSPEIPNWVFGAGGKFGVTREGAVWLSDVHVNNGEMAVTSEMNGTVRIHNGTFSVENTSGDVKVKTAPLVHMNGNTGAIDDKGIAMTFLSDAGEWVAALQMWQNDFQILLTADNVPGGQKFLTMAPKWKYRDDIGYYIGV